MRENPAEAANEAEGAEGVMSFASLLRSENAGADELPGSAAPVARRARTGRRILAASIAAILGGGLVIGATIALDSGSVEAIDGGAVSSAREAPVFGDSGPVDLAPGAARLTPPAEVDPAWVRRVAGSTGIGERALTAYASAASRMSVEQPACGLGWNTLAAIGFVESEHGTLGGSAVTRSGVVSPAIIGIALDGTTTDVVPDSDGGALDRDPVWDRAVGPMQFLPNTWNTWGARASGAGTPDPQNIDDAAYSAARYLCASGDLRDAATWIAAIASFNAATGYNQRVAEAANRYAAP